MKINNKKNKMVKFSSLKEGEVFTIDEEEFYIKIESTYCNDSGDYENIVNLATGTLDFCEDDIVVYPVKCELVIE